MDASSPDPSEASNSLKPKVDPAELMRKVSDAMEAYFRGEGEFHLDLEDLKLGIHLEGPKWQGVVDLPVAEFLIDVEKRLRSEFEKLEIRLPKWERGLLALEVDDGSWDAVLGYTQEAIDFFKTLDISARTVAAGAVMATVGALTTVRNRIRRKVSPVELQKIQDLATAREQQEALDGDHVSVMEVIPEAAETSPADGNEGSSTGLISNLSDEQIETLVKLEKIQGDSAELQRPIKTLLGLMTEADVVTLPTVEEPLKYSEAIEVLTKKTPRPPKQKRPTYYVDQYYTVNTLNSAGPSSKWNVKIEYGGVVFQASLAKLASQDIAKLTSIYDAAFAKGERPGEDLQVTAEFDSKGAPKAAVVIGIGKPRPQNVGLAEAISKGKAYSQKSRK